MMSGCGVYVVLAVVMTACIVVAKDPGYCEAPIPAAMPPTPSTSKLIQAFVLSRHGDRSPLYAIPNEFKDERIVWNCTLATPVRALTSDKTLTSGSGIYYLYENYGTGIFGRQEVWNGNCQTGQLTKLGGEMCTRMGAGLRNVYVDKYQLLPDTLTPETANLVHLRTTDFARTRESLASVMEGLYPTDKRAGVYLPVTIIPVSTDYLHPNAGCCVRLGQLVTNNTINNPEWMSRFNSVKTIIDKINVIAGTRGSSIFDDNYTVDGWADVLHSRECHNLPFPCNEDRSVCVTQEMADAIYPVNDWESCNQYMGDETSKLAAGPFFVDINDAFTAMATTGKGPKYIHYSAHDSTVAMVLAALKFDGGFPPYASTVRFELWQTGDNQYAVQMVYNNQVIRPPDCSNAMCPFNEFQAMVNSRLTIRDKTAECARK